MSFYSAEQGIIWSAIPVRKTSPHFKASSELFKQKKQTEQKKKVPVNPDMPFFFLFKLYYNDITMYFSDLRLNDE